MPATDQWTEVGNTKQVFDSIVRIRNLRAYVAGVLARRNETHVEAATRAGVSKQLWTRYLRAERITPKVLRRIARGLCIKYDDLVATLSKEEEHGTRSQPGARGQAASRGHQQ